VGFVPVISLYARDLRPKGNTLVGGWPRDTLMGCTPNRWGHRATQHVPMDEFLDVDGKCQKSQEKVIVASTEHIPR